MSIPFVIDNQQHRMADALNELLTQTEGKPLDIATAYFAISGYRLVKDRMHLVGAFRLLLGSEPHSGTDIGLRPNTDALMKLLPGIGRNVRKALAPSLPSLRRSCPSAEGRTSPYHRGPLAAMSATVPMVHAFVATLQKERRSSPNPMRVKGKSVIAASR